MGYLPDAVFVALGINDAMSSDVIEETIPVFFEKLASIYPNTPIVAILPITDLQEHDCSRLGAVRAQIRAQAERYDHIRIVDGTRLVPPMEAFYTDGLHPSALGMQLYAFNLAREVSALDL